MQRYIHNRVQFDGVRIRQAPDAQQTGASLCSSVFHSTVTSDVRSPPPTPWHVLMANENQKYEFVAMSTVRFELTPFRTGS
jgi:hypothetical protein